ncbi:MAG: hypothetical protein HY283_07585 [Nitrospirae bacterium]|nr:hypothetical protein [Nitrospirota bacterium]
MMTRADQRWRFLPVAFGLLGLALTAWAEEPLMINQIVIDPKNPDLLYAAARPQGALKSIDRGKTWMPARTGLKNTSTYPLAIDPSNPQILYLGTFGGGVYKSHDGGKTWAEMNEGLGNTNVHALAVDPARPDRIVVGTSTGNLFQSKDGGAHWMPFNQELPSMPGEVFVTLRFDEEHPSRLYLGQEKLYLRDADDSWKLFGEGLQGETVTAFEMDPVGHLIYAGTMKNGLFTSRDGGKTWAQTTPLFGKQWIQTIVLNRAKPGHLYASVIVKGLFKSADQGKTWIKLEGGLPPGDDVLSLAIDPKDPNRLYAGTHNQGIFLSSDEGITWSAPVIKQEPVAAIINSLFSSESNPGGEHPLPGAPTVPGVFNKCSRCHGWTDPVLSQKKTYWRVPPNRRDWRATVKRMSPGAGLTPEEEETVISFLNGYSRTETK